MHIKGNLAIAEGSNSESKYSGNDGSYCKFSHAPVVEMVRWLEMHYF